MQSLAANQLAQIRGRVAGQSLLPVRSQLAVFEANSLGVTVQPYEFSDQSSWTGSPLGTPPLCQLGSGPLPTFASYA